MRLKETIKKIIKEELEKKISSKSILHKLNKGGTKWDSGYHGNPSIGAKPNELHFRKRYGGKIHESDKESIEAALKGLKYRFQGNGLFIENQ